MSDHNGKGRDGSAPHSWNSEELKKASDVVTLAGNGCFKNQLAVDIVKVPSSLNWMVSELEEGFVCLLVPILLHIPAISVRSCFTHF